MKLENSHKTHTLRSNLESAIGKQSHTQYSRFLDSDYSDFSLSPEILSEKLYDSVKMIRDLMNSNKKLKDFIGEVQQQKKVLETENNYLQNENQDLLEKVEMVGNLKGDNRVEVIQLRAENEELLKRIAQLERENKSQGTLSTGKDWAWKSKRTVMRNRKIAGPDKPIIGVGRVTPRAVHRPLSQDFDSSKQDAISTLSQILMKEYSNNIIF